MRGNSGARCEADPQPRFLSGLPDHFALRQREARGIELNFSAAEPGRGGGAAVNPEPLHRPGVLRGWFEKADPERIGSERSGEADQRPGCFIQRFRPENLTPVSDQPSFDHISRTVGGGFFEIVEQGDRIELHRLRVRKVKLQIRLLRVDRVEARRHPAPAGTGVDQSGGSRNRFVAQRRLR